MDVDVLRDLLAAQPRPPCIALTPFRIVAADLEGRLWNADGTVAVHATATAATR